MIERYQNLVTVEMTVQGHFICPNKRKTLLHSHDRVAFLRNRDDPCVAQLLIVFAINLSSGSVVLFGRVEQRRKALMDLSFYVAQMGRSFEDS